MKQGRHLLKSLIGWIFAILLAAVCCFAIYTYIIYQQGSNAEEGDSGSDAGNEASRCPFEQLMDDMDMNPDETGPVLSLPGFQMVNEQNETGMINGVHCSRCVRTYLLNDGRMIEAETAWPAAYMEVILSSDWVVQRVTGCTIGDLNANYYRGTTGTMLVARYGERVFLLHLHGEDADGQAVYSLGALAEFDQGYQ